MLIIGIDPGTVCCGYGIVELPAGKREMRFKTAGDIRLNPKTALPERLKNLHDSLDCLIKEYNPSLLCLEKIFYHKSIRSAFALGSTRGVVMLLAAQNGLPVFEYNPTEVKMALTGYGRAEKRQVQEMVKVILNLQSSSEKFSEDSTDALGLCICHLHSSSFPR